MAAVLTKTPSTTNLHAKSVAGRLDFYILGFTLVLGGQVIQWNHGIEAGIWEFFTSTVLTGAAYICFALCMAELTGTLPFSGGVYGYVRVSVNPMWGFLVGMAETMHHIFMVAALIIPFGTMVTHAMDIDHTYDILVWIITFFVVFVINALGIRVFWACNRVIGVTSILLVLLYVFVSLDKVDFNRYALEGGKALPYDGYKMFGYFPYSSWFFVGLEVFPLSASYSNHPKTFLPQAITISAIVAFCTAIAIYFVAVSQRPGVYIIHHEDFPLSHGFASAFNISHHAATWLSVPSVFGAIFGFTFAFGRQMTSLAHSGLLPISLQSSSSSGSNSSKALLAGTILSFSIAMWIHYMDAQDTKDLFAWAWLGSYFVYIFTFISFIEMRQKFSVLQRQFVNPLGIPSAVVGMAIFSINMISVVAFQGQEQSMIHRFHPVIGLAVCAIFAVTWYFTVAKYSQCFSSEEQKIMFSAYIIKANVKGRSKQRKHHHHHHHHGHHGHRPHIHPLLRSISSASKLFTVLSKSTSSNLMTNTSTSSLFRISSKSADPPSVFVRHGVQSIIAEESEWNMSNDDAEDGSQHVGAEAFHNEEEQHKFIESIVARPRVIANLLELGEKWSNNSGSHYNHNNSAINSSGSGRSHLTNNSDIRKSISISERFVSRFSTKIARQRSNQDIKVVPTSHDDDDDNLDVESVHSRNDS